MIQKHDTINMTPPLAGSAGAPSRAEPRAPVSGDSGTVWLGWGQEDGCCCRSTQVLYLRGLWLDL